ncbi:PREDICTED: uncharacterized protein LOC106749371 isoform X2 [Dinoponera quadriceps]|uniref:Uncharacterized protein LOC106749371 isoform X2 n=1 Tax=Dinoponera quadriceps TaxID=609295 RepID=A0A6P3Y267_DINQU|nr:PREDICTED: uncharacterized protein LOC106749371 isoform X2 [Dinoponera quadriceps]
MFYLDGRGDAAAITTTTAKYDSLPPNGEENFGWWLSHWKIAVSPRSRRDEDHYRSPGSSASMLSCVDSDDSSCCTFTQNSSAGRQEKTYENIELRMFARDDLDIGLIKRDAQDNWPTGVTEDEYDARNESKCEVVCCSPERLIRCQEYRIHAPSCRRSSRARCAPEVEACRARLSCGLIDPERIGGTQSKLPCAACSPVIARSRRADDDFGTETRSSCDRLNSTWDNCNGSSTRLYSLEDTSDIQSNDCSSNRQSDAPDTPMCLCDELAIASKDRVGDHNRGTAINEVASILEGFRNDPEKALLEEEDRFYDCRSSHDQLTRLALAIETDAEEAPAILGDPNNWLRQLRDKIERLQHGHKEIRGDIRALRGDFQRDERKIGDVSGNTARLRGEIRELRYLDDLLTLIQGELARISRRSWPFILGNNEPREEINLIV